MKEKICKNCKWFYSYRIIYEDDLEPDDCGWCKEPAKIEAEFLKQKGYEFVIWEDTCDKFDELKNQKQSGS